MGDRQLSLMNSYTSVADHGAERPFAIEWWPNRIIFEPDAVARVGALLAEIGRSRAFVICGKSIASSQALERVTCALGGSCAGVFTEIEMHAPLPVLERG